MKGRARQRRPLALLALLSCSPERQLSRDKAIAYLWPEMGAGRARRLLSVTLHAVRKALGPQAVESVGDDLQLNEQVVGSDVVAFKAALEAGAAERAVEVYEGPFLDGFYLQGAEEFERWVEEERARLAGLYGRALQELAVRAEAEGKTEEAVEWLRKLAAHDPYSSRVAVHLMRALDAAGDRPGALQQARIHAERVRAELGMPPDPKVLDLAEALEHGEVARALRPLELKAVASELARASSEPSPAAPLPHSPAPEATLGGSASRRRRGWLLGLTAAAGGLLLFAIVRPPSYSSSSEESWDRSALVPHRVVILPLENQTGDVGLDPVAFMAADWLTQGVAQTGLLEVVSAAPVLAWATEVGRETGRIPAGRRWLRTVAEETKAGTAVWGSYYADGERIRFQVHVSDLANDRLLGTVGPVSGTRDAPLEAVEELRQRVLGFLAVEFDERLANAVGTAWRPPTFDAYLEYVAGLEAPSRRERLAHFRRAHALDSSFVTPLVQGLVLVLDARDPRFDTLFHILDRVEHRLSEVDRLSVEGWRAFAMAFDREGAYRAWRRAAALAPDRQWLAGLGAFGIGHYREYTEILLNESYPPFWNPFPWKSVTAALHFLGEHERELETARRGKEEHPADLRFYGMEALALAALGRSDELRRVVDEALGGAHSDRMRDDAFLHATGVELRWHGHPNLAREMLTRAARLQREQVATHPDSIWLRGRLILTLIDLEEFQEGRELLYVLSDGSPFVEATAGSGWLQLNWWRRAGVVGARSGDRAEAARILELLERYEVSPDEESRAAWAVRGRDAKVRAMYAVFWSAQIAGALEECEQAAELLEKALKAGVAHYMIHGRVGFYPCREHPAFLEVARPRG